MKKKILMVLCASLLLCGCSSSKKVNISSWEKEIELLKESSSIKDKFKHYEKCEKILERIEYEKDQLAYSLKKEDHDEKSSYFQNLYWEVKTSFYNTLQEIFKVEETKDYFITELGEGTVNEYINTDTSRFFYAQKLENYDFTNIENKITSLELAYENKEDITSIRNKYLIFYEELCVLQKVYEKAFIFSCLDVNDEEALNIASECEVKGTIYSNRSLGVFKNMLNDSKYKDYVAIYFNLNEDEINEILSSSIYSSTVKELMEEESSLVSSYSSLKTDNEKKDLYVKLVRVRQEIAKELGYDSYLEYVYKEIYKRDYSVSDSLNLCSNLLSSSRIKSLYHKLGESNYFTSSYYDSKYLSSLVCSESSLWNALSKCEEVLPNTHELISYIKGNGLYNFETRSNKIGMSFVSSYHPLDTYFMMINATSTALDYSTTIHEFGHYYGMKYSSPSKASTSSTCLELAEIHSQGLEYLMSNYYDSFLSEKDANQLEKMNLFNALWVIQSSICVFELEYYAYTTSELTVSKLDNAFNRFVQLTTYPFSFGIDDYGNPVYTNIIHIYQQPGYYISYLLSLIPSLEIYASPLEEGIQKYNDLISYGERNVFSDVLSEVGISSPFEVSTLDKIASKFEEVIK